MDNALEIVLSAKDEASDVIAGFGDELNNILEIATGFSLANVADELAQVGKSAIDAAVNFQAVTVSLATVLGNVSDSGDEAATSFGGSASKMKDIAMQTADEMRSYAEKVKKINDDIATASAGQDVIDAQASMYQQLDDLAQAHADKIESLQQQITDAQTGEQNNLSDMQDSHDNKMADLAEKHAQEMNDATGQLQRDALQKKYDEEVQYENDSFQRQYDTKKKQLDRDTQQKIQSLQDQISQENTLYDQKYAQEQEKDQDNVAKLEEDNQKKLAQYKQELEDEEIAHTEHLQKLQEEAASGGGGGISAKMQELPINSQFRLTAESAKGLQQYLSDTFSKGTPFKLDDWEEFAKTMSEAKINAQQMAPAIENIAAANNVDLSTAAQAIFQGMQGNVRALSSTLHISAEELHNAGAEFTQSGTLKDKESFFTALEKIGTQNYAGGLKNLADTFKGTSQEVSNDFEVLGLKILGFDDATGKLVKGGIMDEMQKGLKDLGDYLESHQKEVEDFFQSLFKAIGDIANLLNGEFGQAVHGALIAAMGTASQIVGETFKLFHDNKGEIQDVADKFKGIMDQLVPLYNHLDKMFGPLIKQLVEVEFKEFVDTLDAAATGLETILGWVNKLFDYLDKPHAGLNILKNLVGLNAIPHFASGTNDAPGGLSLVGENGPELVNLPQHAQVIPNSQINNNRNANITLGPVYISSPMDVDSMMRRLSFAYRTDSSL